MHAGVGQSSPRELPAPPRAEPLKRSYLRLGPGMGLGMDLLSVWFMIHAGAGGGRVACFPGWFEVDLGRWL